MTRLLTATIFLITFGLAFAQPPVDYTLLCEVEGDTTVVGAASYVDGELHVALDEAWTCGGTLTVEQEPDMTVEIDEAGEVTLTLADGDAMSGIPQTLPEEAIAGMVTAQQNRAMAAEHREDAEGKAEAARERAGSAPEDVEKEAPKEEAPEMELPETPDEDVAPEVSGSAGSPANVGGAAKGRP